MLLGTKQWTTTLSLFMLNCYSNRVSCYNENFAWKMGLDISKDKEWMKMYIALRKEIKERLNTSLKSVVKNDPYISPKLTTKK